MLLSSKRSANLPRSNRDFSIPAFQLESGSLASLLHVFALILGRKRLVQWLRIDSIHHSSKLQKRVSLSSYIAYVTLLSIKYMYSISLFLSASDTSNYSSTRYS